MKFSIIVVPFLVCYLLISCESEKDLSVGDTPREKVTKEPQTVTNSPSQTDKPDEVVRVSPEARTFNKLRTRMMSEPLFYSGANLKRGEVRMGSLKDVMAKRRYDVFSRFEFGHMSDGSKNITVQIDSYKWGNSIPSTQHITVPLNEDTTVRFYQAEGRGFTRVTSSRTYAAGDIPNAEYTEKYDKTIPMYKPRNAEDLVEVIKHVRDLSKDEYAQFIKKTSQAVEFKSSEGFESFKRGS